MYIDFLKKVFLVYREMELSYIFSKKVFLVFWEIELSSPKIKNFQEATFPSQKKATLKKFLKFWEMDLSRRKLKKNSYIS